jgi:hypothetical protein
MANPADIIIKLEYPFNDVPEENRRNYCRAALHCCMNGPVGTNKLTNFPGIDGKTKINAIAPGITNRQWTNFCTQVARWLVEHNPNVDCQAIKRFQKFWPLCTWVPK